MTAPQPFSSAYLSVSHQHQLYYAQFGDPQKPAALFLHGGPASSCSPALAKLFPLEHCHLVQFDQRGSGQSQPHGELKDNNTQALVEDIETLRKHLNIPHWHVIYGGSWGATLALEYAKAYRQTIKQLVLRGSFLARPQDLAWFIEPSGLAQKLPDAYQALCQTLQSPQHQSLIEYLFQQLQHPTEHTYSLVQAWNQWECAAMGIKAPTSQPDAEKQATHIRQLRLYLHYCLNQFFLGEQGALANHEILTDLPITAIHGIHDQVCPLHLAKDLKHTLPHTQWIEIDAGHGIFEKLIAETVTQALSHCFVD